MPLLSKDALSKYIQTGCRRQLRLYLYPDTQAYESQVGAFGYPPRQDPRPGLQQFRQAGADWQREKMGDLARYFGQNAIIGRRNATTANAFDPMPLAEALDQARAGTFIAEAHFDTRQFAQMFNLDQLTDSNGFVLDTSEFRPDLIIVNPPGSADKCVLPDGHLAAIDPGDQRLQLQLLEVKLTSEPSPSYYAETVLYSIALAGWLVQENFYDRFIVTSKPVIWPGSHEESLVEQLATTQPRPSSQQLLLALRNDWALAPFEVFAARLRQILTCDIWEILQASDWRALAWHVDNRCRSCEFLGYDWSSRDPSSGRNPHPSHCLPQARAEQHLSQIAFVTRGAAGALRNRNINTTNDVVSLTQQNPVFDDHHGLRQSREILSNRARSLVRQQAFPPPTGSTSAVLPGYASRKIYLTVDFEVSQAITFAVGVLARGAIPSWPNAFQGGGNTRFNIYITQRPTLQQEETQVLAFLSDLASLLTPIPGQNETFQIYIWDELQFRHLCRVIGRHLAAIVTQNRVTHLAWLFPPEEILPNYALEAGARPGSNDAETPPVALVRNAVRALVAAPVPHYYSLLGVARAYHPTSLQPPYNAFNVHPLFEDPLSDMIPSERAHDIWSGGPNWATQLTRLSQTVRTRLNALEAVEHRLSEDLRNSATYRAPRIRTAFSPTANLSGSIHPESRFWYLHWRLESALEEAECRTIRAMPPYEREARFHSARLTVRLNRTLEQAALAAYGMPASLRLRVYELAPTSSEFKAKDGDINFALNPLGSPAVLERSAKRFTQGSSLESTYDNDYHTRMQDILAVTVAKIDRVNRRIVVQLNDYNGRDQHVRTLETQGLLPLGQDVMLDPIHHDFVKDKLQRALQALGNPGGVQPFRPGPGSAIGYTGRPRRTAQQAADRPLWRANVMATEAFLPGVSTLRSQLTGVLDLNPSQWTAWIAALTYRCRLIWGPPGTGKSHTLQAIIIGALVAAAAARGRMHIAVCCSTYTAIDNVLRDLPSSLTGAGLALSDIELVRLRSTLSTEPGPADFEDLQVANTSRLLQLRRNLLNNHCDSLAVVGVTPSQMVKFSELDDSPTTAPFFDLLIVDEASQMDVTQAILAFCGLAPQATVVFAGDPQQLPPIQQSEPPTGLETLVGNIYEYVRERFSVPVNSLETNYRSNRVIVEASKLAGYSPSLHSHSPLLSLRFQTPVLRSPSSNWPAALPWSARYTELLAPDRPLTCFVYSDPSSSQQNRFEAQQIAAITLLLSERLSDGLANEINRQGQLIQPATTLYQTEDLWRKGIGIVTPHRAQQALVIRYLEEVFVPRGVRSELIRQAVDTVERFQGQQRDVILASYSAGDPDAIAEEEEFLLSLNRFNVTTSRARAKLILFITREMLDHIAAEIETIHESAMMKSFVDLHCNSKSTAQLAWIDQNQTMIPVPGTIVWRPF
jgi:DNA replication ATP-dependent helicase Dna2